MKFTLLHLTLLYLLNSLWPNDAIWRHRSRSTLAQVMAYCLTAPSHYLNQCWLIFSKVQWHSVEDNLTRDSLPFNPWNKLENYLSKILFKSFRDQWVNVPTWPEKCNCSHQINQTYYLLPHKNKSRLLRIDSVWTYKVPQNYLKSPRTF